MTRDELQQVYHSCKTPLAVAEAFCQVSEADRKKLSRTAQELYKSARQGERDNWGMPSQEGAVARLAMLACCPWSQAKRVGTSGRGMFPDRGPWMEAACQILTDRRPAWAGDWIILQLDSSDAWGWQVLLRWNDVRELMRAGVIERPATDGYIRVLAQSGYFSLDLDRDADTLENDIWQLFEVENTAFDIFPDPKKIDRNRWRTGEQPTQPGPLHEPYNGWPRTLYQLAYEGKIDRGQLIDAILAGLWHDFRSPMRTGLLRFLDVLDITNEEIAQREPALLELLRTERGPVAGMALKSLARLQKAKKLDATAFLAAVPAVFTISSKSQPKSAVSLIKRIVANDAVHLAAAVEAVRAALQHALPDIQEIAVNLLARWKATNDSIDLRRVADETAGLSAHNESVSTNLRKRKPTTGRKSRAAR